MGSSVLVVDDSVVIRTFIKGYLAGEAGCEIREAGNGQEAVDACRAAMPDVIFLDLTMPVMDGTTALGLIRAMDPTAQVAVVTADIQAKSIQRVMELGAALVLKKPPVKEEVLQAFQTLLARKGGSR